MTDSNRKPIHELRLGRVKAAIWQHETEKGTHCNVTFSKLYLDKDNKWKDTQSFGKADLLLLSEVAREAASILYRDENRAE